MIITEPTLSACNESRRIRCVRHLTHARLHPCTRRLVIALNTPDSSVVSPVGQPPDIPALSKCRGGRQPFGAQLHQPLGSLRSFHPPPHLAVTSISQRRRPRRRRLVICPESPPFSSTEIYGRLRSTRHGGRSPCSQRVQAVREAQANGQHGRRPGRTAQGRLQAASGSGGPPAGTMLELSLTGGLSSSVQREVHPGPGKEARR